MLNNNLQQMQAEEEANRPKTDRPKMETGTYPAICNLLVDLGEHDVEKFEKKGEFSRHRMLWIGFIFPTEQYEVEFDDEVHTRYQVLGKEMKFSPNEKSNLVQWHRTLCPADSAVSELLGAGAAISVALTSGNNPKVGSVGKPMKGMAVKLPEDAELLMIDESKWDNIDDYDLPPFLVDKVKSRIGGPDQSA